MQVRFWVYLCVYMQSARASVGGVGGFNTPKEGVYFRGSRGGGAGAGGK